MDLKDLHVVVVGGAVGGASTALLLAGAGARVSLFERVARPRAVGAGLGLAENGLAVLHGIGLGPALANVARDVPAPRVVDGAGRLLADASDRTRIQVVRRADLQGVLLDALAAHPHVDAAFGVEAFRAEPDGTVHLRRDGREERVQADLVVAADGVHSAIREAGAFGGQVRRTGVWYVRGLGGPGLDRGEEAWTAEGLFGSIPVAGGTYFYASTGRPETRAALDAGDLDAWRAAWARAYPPSAAILADVKAEDLLRNEVLEVHCRTWVDGRVVLLGDAAHAMAPNLGQGANSALVDAAVLLDTLRAAPDVASAAAAYEARRRPRVEAVARMAWRLGRLAHVTRPVARWARDRILMPIASRGPTVNRDLLLQEPVERLTAIAAA